MKGLHSPMGYGIIKLRQGAAPKQPHEVLGGTVMFIAIANVDHNQMLDNCNIGHWEEYYTEMENPIFIAMTFESTCATIKQYYRTLDNDICPDYTIYEISDGSWTVEGARAITLDITRHDA